MSQGSVEEFKANWQRPEAEYCHFTRDEPVNQIQFAFRQNWLEFAKIMEPLKPWAGRKALEVGAGRGTMSMYFADAGFDVSLLDACESPLIQAHKAFRDNRLDCETFSSDAAKLPFADESFDVVHSYGLMEHFDDLVRPFKEQARVLKPGGCLIAYVVPTAPKRDDSMFGKAWDSALRQYGGGQKSPVHRNGYSEDFYLAVLDECGVGNAFQNRSGRLWVYPFPIISASPEFPFTLNSPEVEREIVQQFTASNMGWDSGYSSTSQAFIVWGWKR